MTWTGHSRLIPDGAENGKPGEVWTPNRDVSTFPGPIPQAIKGQLSLWTSPQRKVKS